MPSEFGIYNTIPEDKGIPEPINVDSSGRYDFFRTRIYGRLHFVKRLKNEYATDLRSLDALQKEFRVGYNLDHPGIVRYLRYEDMSIYEEYVDGKTLRKLMDSADESVASHDRLCNICLEMLEAVGYMHSRGVLHLDLKPENVMITRLDGHVKIIDLGCCVSSTFDASPGFTKESMAPEQAAGDTLDVATDIYLVGKIMESLSAAAGCRRKWKSFLRRAMAADAVKRFHSAEEAIKAIGKIRDRGGASKCILRYASFAAIVVVTAAALYMLSDKRPEYTVADAGRPRVDTVLTIVREVAVDKVDSLPEVKSSTSARVHEASYHPRESSEEKFRRLLSKHIFDHYLKHVKPVCKRPTEEFHAEGKYHMSEIQEVKKRAMIDARVYAGRLKSENPGHDDEIDRMLYSVLTEVEAQTVAWMPAEWMSN